VVSFLHQHHNLGGREEEKTIGGWLRPSTLTIHGSMEKGAGGPSKQRKWNEVEGNSPSEASMKN